MTRNTSVEGAGRRWRVDLRGMPDLGVEPLRGLEKLCIGGRPARDRSVANLDRAHGPGAPDDLPSGAVAQGGAQPTGREIYPGG